MCCWQQTRKIAFLDWNLALFESRAMRKFVVDFFYIVWRITSLFKVAGEQIQKNNEPHGIVHERIVQTNTWHSLSSAEHSETILPFFVKRSIQLRFLSFSAERIKRGLDKSFGASWHVVVGEEFALDIDYDDNLLLSMLYGNVGIVAWKVGLIHGEHHPNWQIQVPLSGKF